MLEKKKEFILGKNYENYGKMGEDDWFKEYMRGQQNLLSNINNLTNNVVLNLEKLNDKVHILSENIEKSIKSNEKLNDLNKAGISNLQKDIKTNKDIYKYVLGGLFGIITSLIGILGSKIIGII
jgi:hypothetical protein